MNDFLPTSYEVPQKAGSYMKFQTGENRFRVLASPIIGWEWWEEKQDGTRKPVRVTMDTKIPVDSVEDPSTIKHFWAMPVYNYKEGKIQILEITQKGIQKKIKSLARDDDWGTPLGYDLVVIKTGEKLETEYEVNPKPAKKLDPSIVSEYEGMNIEMEALYRGDDPFNSKKEEINPDDIPDFMQD